jgi:hypothetical protein
MSIVSPIAKVRAAVMVQLAATLNTNLVASCTAYGVPVIAFDFSPGSKSVIQANIGYGDTEDSGVANLNLLTVYGGTATPFPAGGSQKLFNAAWSGRVPINLDLYIGVLGEKVRDFEPYADAGEQAVIATMNAFSAQTNLSEGGMLYGFEITSVHGKCGLDGENWIVPVKFAVQCEVYIGS